MSRSGYYYRPRPVSEEDLLLMRLIDEEYMRHPSGPADGKFRSRSAWSRRSGCRWRSASQTRASAKSPHDATTARPHCSSVRPLRDARTSTATGGARTVPGTCHARSAAALGAAQQQTLHLATDGSHPTQEGRPRNLARPIIAPALEQLARRTPQTTAKVFRPAVAAVDHRLKIAFRWAQHHCNRPRCQTSWPDRR